METSRMAGNSFQRRRLLRRLEGGNLQAEGFHTRLGNQTMVTNTRNLTKTHAINEIASLLLKLIFQPRILKPPELEELLRKAAALRSFLRLQQEIPNLIVPNAATCAQDPNLTGPLNEEPRRDLPTAGAPDRSKAHAESSRRTGHKFAAS